MTSDRDPSTRGPFRDQLRSSVTSPKVQLGHSYLTRRRVSPVRHIVVERAGWVQLCTGQPAIRSHAGKVDHSNCPACRTAWKRDAA